ncbi:N-acetyltransferase [Vibrio sp. MACH09]|uniref:GNAT family N-acetyltransferase n=1 Tax=unclassified Vibrio TaxID=2614977 RepID=UPI0014935201|nr:MULTISPECIES: GNAT family N-acetyltransferase [unclassified Vibrio]NOI65855.1 GNAT family N-acetyltransferase [Vibrio sp. 99-8-1]GLO59814.1 N-acetyltransferase [Vibrio sp. MACH09]
MAFFKIRSITPSDNPDIAQVIRQVSYEYGLTEDKGFSVGDPTLDNLYQVYQTAKAHYWVIEQNGKVLGGAGIAPLQGEEATCELQKMYLLPVLRGKGLAKKLAQMCFQYAKQQGYKHCYLETTADLKEAISLYKALGFQQIEHAMGSTGHCDCEIRMLKPL